MAGTVSGGKVAARKNKERYDEQYAEYGGFYSYIGRRGGEKSRGGAFINKEFASEMGKRGGKVSKRGKNRDNF